MLNRPATLFTIWNSIIHVAVLFPSYIFLSSFNMDFYHIFLLLLLVLSTYSHSFQHGNPLDYLDFTIVAVCPNSSSDPLGVLTPVLPQSEMFGLELQDALFKFQNGTIEVVLFQTGMNCLKMRDSIM